MLKEMISGQMKAAVLRAPGRIACEVVDIPRLGPGDVLVRVMAAGVCGSDIPRVMVTGAHRSPIIPGHEFAGEVCDIGEGVQGVEVGDRIVVIPLIPCGVCKFCRSGCYNLCVDYDYLGSRTDGGFAEYVRVPARNLVPIPEGLDYEIAALTEPSAVALHGVRRVGVNPGDSVAIFGAGAVGMLVAQWARALGAQDIYLVDTVAWKFDVARELGFDTDKLIDASKADAAHVILDATRGEGVTVAIEAAGHPASLRGCIDIASRCGRVLLLGNPHADVTLPQGLISGILRKELNLYGTWNSEFRPYPVNEWETALRFMKAGLLQIKPLISHRFSLEDVTWVFDMMYSGKEPFNRVMFLPNG